VSAKERPILFSGPMVRALLEGRKTQTRRLMKPQPVHGAEYASKGFEPPCALHLDFYGNPIGTHTCPYGVPGDRLWVREAWWHDPECRIPMDLNHPGRPCVRYSADYDFQGKGFGRQRSSIHMPRWASRITLEVTEVRVQRLHEISGADAYAEGCSEHGPEKLGLAVHEFARQWRIIHGPEGWESNPWVWAISFKPAPLPSQHRKG
jgi:hypothetical protein